MFGAVYLLVAELHSVRVVRLHHEMPFAHGAFEALSVEDDFVHGNLLHQVNPFVATLTLVAGASGRAEQVRQALRRPHRRGGHLVVAASDGVRYTQLNKSITLPCAVCVAAGCGRPLQCSTGVSVDFMYYSIGINNGTTIHELNGGMRFRVERSGNRVAAKSADRRQADDFYDYACAYRRNGTWCIISNTILYYVWYS